MSDLEQYSPPAADVSAPPVRKKSFAVTPNMVTSLKDTRPWVLLIAVIFILGGGMMILGSAGIAFMGVAGADESMPVAMVIGMACMYFLMGLLYLVPAIFMFRFSSAVKEMLNGGEVPAMEKTLSAQKSIWKSFGIIVILAFVLSIVFVVLMLVIGGAAAFQGM